MKKLTQFTYFDAESFFKDKELEVTSLQSWDDKDSGLHYGTKVELAITQDNTKYQLKENESVTNVYEKFWAKTEKDIKVPIRSKVRMIGITASVFGEFKNQLNVYADDIVTVTK